MGWDLCNTNTWPGRVGCMETPYLVLFRRNLPSMLTFNPEINGSRHLMLLRFFTDTVFVKRSINFCELLSSFKRCRDSTKPWHLAIPPLIAELSRMLRKNKISQNKERHTNLLTRQGTYIDLFSSSIMSWKLPSF